MKKSCPSIFLWDQEPFKQAKLDCLHDNPCRKGLLRAAAHWRYSWPAWYATDGKRRVDVPLTPIAR